MLGILIIYAYYTRVQSDPEARWWRRQTANGLSRGAGWLEPSGQRADSSRLNVAEFFYVVKNSKHGRAIF